MNSISILVSIFLLAILGCNGQTGSTLPTTDDSTTPAPLDAYAGGRPGNPGALLRFSAKALDSVLTHAMETIAKTIKTMTIPEVMVGMGNGMLTIKNARLTEVKIGGAERQLVPNKRIRSRFYGTRLAAVGQWCYKSHSGEQRTRNMMSGEFRTIVVDAELNMTNQLERMFQGKPQVRNIDCKVNLSNFRVEIDGLTENTYVISQCNNNNMCTLVRSYFENNVCNAAKSYVHNFINQKLLTIPTRVKLGPTCNRFVMDYGLLLSEPTAAEQHVQGYLEGDVLSRGHGRAPFEANAMSDFDDDDDSESSDSSSKSSPMLTFRLSDYAFNTLFHHAHAQQFKFSAYDLIPASSQAREHLKVRCQAESRTLPGGKARSATAQRPGPKTSIPCLGTVFDNMTLSEGSDGLGDLVFKTQRPFHVLIQSPSLFGVDSGTVEAYGPAGADGKRELLGRADVRYLRASFLPKLSGCNITGDVVVYSLKLTPSTPVIARYRSLPDAVISKLETMSVVLFNEVFRAFLAQYAQFPVPLFEGLECLTPELKIDTRTVQLRSEIRVLPEATRVGKKL